MTTLLAGRRSQPTGPRIAPGSAALLAITLVVTPHAARGQTSSALFAPSVLQELRLFVNEQDLTQLRAHYEANTYFPADLHWGGARVRNVGIRSRGFGSRNPQKLGLRIDFDRYVTGQRFVEMRSVVLDNLWQDPSMLREAVAMALFARMGQPASREVFARVFINERYEGLYAIVEPVDTAYLQRTTGESTGALFEYRWQRPYAFEDLGDDLAAYRAMWDAETNQLESLAVQYSPFREMARAIARPIDAAWRTEVDRYVDLPQMVTHVAIETFLAEIDGFVGQWGLNNVYLYRAPLQSRHIVIPWDRDHAFQSGANTSIFDRLQSNRLVAGALAFADLRATYLDVLQRCADAAAQEQWLESQILQLNGLTSQAAAEDARKPYSTDAHAADVAGLVAFARQRSGYVRAEVAQALGR
jgi:spore coat protein CotH